MGEERVEVEGVYGTKGDMFKPDQIDEEMSDGEGIETQKKGARSTRGGSATSTSTSATRPRPAAEGSKVSSSESIPSSSTRSSHRSTRSIDTAKAQQHASPALSSANSVTSPGPESSALFPTNSQNPLTMTREELDRWFTIRLGELSHKTDKILCRSWIREIEPHKQTRFQYQKGDETKPAWWPADIRHKEPDHLGKQGELLSDTSSERQRLIYRVDRWFFRTNPSTTPPSSTPSSHDHSTRSRHSSRTDANPGAQTTNLAEHLRVCQSRASSELGQFP